MKNTDTITHQHLANKEMHSKNITIKTGRREGPGFKK